MCGARSADDEAREEEEEEDADEVHDEVREENEALPTLALGVDGVEASAEKSWCGGRAGGGDEVASIGGTCPGETSNATTVAAERGVSTAVATFASSSGTARSESADCARSAPALALGVNGGAASGSAVVLARTNSASAPIDEGASTCGFCSAEPKIDRLTSSET